MRLEVSSLMVLRFMTPRIKERLCWRTTGVVAVADAMLYSVSVWIREMLHVRSTAEM